MRSGVLPLLARGCLGGIVGFGIWFSFSNAYNDVLAAASEAVTRFSERSPATHLRAADDVLTIERDDPADRTHARAELHLSVLTTDIILLTILFATNHRTVSVRNLGGYLLASVVLFGVHLIAVTANVQAIYALQLGRWSDLHYNALQKNAWGAAAHFLTLVGSHALAVAIWWIFRGSRGLTAQEGVT